MINRIILILILINVIDKKKIKKNIKILIDIIKEYHKKKEITINKLTKEEYEEQEKALKEWENNKEGCYII